MTGSVPTTLSFLDAVTGHLENTRTSSADRPIRLAVVDPAYNPFANFPDPIPPARVTFEGESTLSGKAYAVASGFVPRAGQRVWMVPVGTTYLVAGAVNNQTPQGFWQDPDGVDAGVELGGGSYFDTTEGLYLETDATVAGDLQVARVLHAARGLRVPEIQPGTVALNGPGAGTSISATVTFPVPWPVGTSPIVLTGIVGSAGGTGTAYARPQAITHSNFVAQIMKSDAARANFVAGENFTVHWVAFATPASF